MESDTALSRSVPVALYLSYVGSFSLIPQSRGTLRFTIKFTGIHTMDFLPLAGLASTTLQLETSFQSSTADWERGGKGERGEGGNKGREEKEGNKTFLTRAI